VPNAELGAFTPVEVVEAGEEVPSRGVEKLRAVYPPGETKTTEGLNLSDRLFW
jgi:hypothetical protein